MSYAKLIDGNLQPSPNPIYIAPYWVGNPTGEMLTAEGYKPVRYTEPPQTEPGYVAVPGWYDEVDAIRQVWTVEIAPVTEEEALVRFSNELTGAEDETLLDATETLIKHFKED